MKAIDFCFEFLFGAMRLPVVFAIKSFASSRDSGASSDNTYREPHHAHSQNSSDFKFVRCVRVDGDVKLHDHFVSFKSCVSTADQMRDLRASPAFAKYKCDNVL